MSLRPVVATLVLPLFASACFDPTQSPNAGNDDDGSTSGDATTPTTVTMSGAVDADETGTASDSDEASTAVDSGESSTVGAEASETAVTSSGVDASGDDSSGDGSTSDGSSSDGSSDDAAEESTTAEAPVCGDGVIAGDESCDDGDADDADGCTGCAIDAGHVCTDEPSLCGAVCDPLLQDCGGAEGCYAAPEGALCLADISGAAGAQNQPCETLNDCNPGLVCLEAVELPDCAGAACCTSWCDLSNPLDECPGALVCIDVPALPGAQDVGACVSA